MWGDKMYGNIRTLIIVFLAIIGIIIIKRFFGNQKKLYIIMGTLLIILRIISSFLPFENLFMTFDSPETVYTYQISKEVIKTINGENSTLVVGAKGNTREILIIPKIDETHWKIGIPGDTKRISHTNLGNIGISLYYYKNTAEYYIVVTCLKTDPFSISDSENSEFVYIEKEIDTTDFTLLSCYAYIPNFSKEYSVTINDTQIGFSDLLS